MPLDINGYGAQFNQFVSFAEQQMQAGKSKAVARADAAPAGALQGHAITAAKGDWVGIGIGRLRSQKDANNVARNLFKNTIAKIFGGEDHIPDSVKDAMKMQDFGKGKPLTARRIIAVRNAIDASGILQQREIEGKIAPAALAKGYSKVELPNVAKAVYLFAQTMGCSDAEALEQVTTPGSKANRLMNYGGRFLQSADNFRNGMRLLDSFSQWFDETGAALKEIHANTLNPVYREGLSKTLYNGVNTVFTAEHKRQVERFAFEELAHNPSANLAETDPEKLFGLENNQAMCCIGRNLQSSRAQTFAQVPPEKRTTFFKAINILRPLYASNLQEAQIPESRRKFIKGRHFDVPVARILKNLDALAALEAKGKLTAANLVKLCFPDIPKPGRNPVEDVRVFVNDLEDDVGLGSGKYPEEYTTAMFEAMKSTGCTAEEALQVAKGERQIPDVPYYSTGTLPLSGLGDPQTARKELAGDLVRTDNYRYNGSPLLLEKPVFLFNFPDGESIAASGREDGKANIPTILDKLETLCGAAHPGQASSLMMMTSQSGLGILKGGLDHYGVKTNEHTVVDFTLSKNETTGDITVRYSSPRKLPFHFEWTATIKTDGAVSTTPLRFLDDRQFKACKAGAARAITNMQETRVTHNQQFALDRNRAEPLIGAMMRASGGDQDVIDLLADPFVCTGLLYNSQNELRSPETIQSRVAALKENVAELREATKGDEQMWKMGMIGLSALGGRPIPKGAVAALVKAVRSVDVGKLENLSSAADTPLKMHAAIAQFHQAVTLARQQSGINQILVGGEEIFGARTLTGRLLAARFGEETLRAIKGALESPVAGQLMAIYEELQDVPFNRDLPKEYEADVVHDKGPELSSDITSLLDSVNEALGIEKSVPPRFRGDAQELDGFDDICFDVMDLTKNLHADEIETQRQKLEYQYARNRAAANANRNGNVVVNP